MSCHAILHGLATLAGNVARSYGNLCTRENEVHFFRGGWDMLERTYDGGHCALLQDRAAG